MLDAGYLFLSCFLFPVSCFLFLVSCFFLTNSKYMHFSPFPFSITDFAAVTPEVHQGETGYAEWKVIHRDEVRIRLVTYSPGYLADHWCSKGHIIFCIEGEMETELEDGRIMKLTKGMTYFVGDNNDAHRTSSENGCKLFIVD